MYEELTMPGVPFTSETAYSAFCRRAGLASARAEKQRGYPNLQRARAALLACGRVRNFGNILPGSPFHPDAKANGQDTVGWEAKSSHEVRALDEGLWLCSCGLSGRLLKSIVSMHKRRLA